MFFKLRSLSLNEMLYANALYVMAEDWQDLYARS